MEREVGRMTQTQIRGSSRTKVGTGCGGRSQVMARLTCISVRVVSGNLRLHDYKAKRMWIGRIVPNCRIVGTRRDADISRGWQRMK